MSDKLSYDNNQAYNWASSKNRRHNTKRQPLTVQTSEPNDSDTSSLSSVSSSQAPDHSTISKKQQSHMCTNGNVSAQLGKSKRFPSQNRTPMNTRAAGAKTSAINTLSQSEITLHTSTVHPVVSQVSPNHTGGTNETTTESVFHTAPIFTQPVHGPKKMGILDPLHPKQPKTNSK